MGVARLDSLALAIERFADDWPEALAVIDGARTWSWSDLHTLSHRYASELAGVRGTTDVVFLPAGGEALALLAACEVAGLRAILVAPPYSETRALAIRETFAARRVVAASGDSIRILAGADTPVAAEDAATPAILVLTSGTTGAPKCAVHTWSTLSAAVKERDSYAERRWMIAYPLSHFAALQVVAQCVFNRGTLVIPRDFGAPAALHALRDQGVEYLCATPTYMRQVLRASSQADWDAMALAHVTMGGEIVDQPLLDSLRARRPGLELTHTYASTELGAMVSVRDGRAGFDAALADGNDLAIRDGELFARRSHRSMVSYVGDDAAPADEWVATGDLVEIVDGRALFRGRTTDVINVGGYKVNPLAIEAVIREIEGVRDVLVIGRKSSITGHLIKAVVCGESTVDPAALQEAITRLCTERLPAYMVPRLFEFVDQLERTAAQKVARSSSS